MMCKHIHKVHSILTGRQVAQGKNLASRTREPKFVTPQGATVRELEEKKMKKKLNDIAFIQDQLDKLQELAMDSSVQALMLPHLKSSLSQLVIKCEAVKSCVESCPASMNVTDPVKPNQNFSYIKKTKRRKRKKKKKASFLETPMQKKKVAESLLAKEEDVGGEVEEDVDQSSSDTIESEIEEEIIESSSDDDAIVIESDGIVVLPEPAVTPQMRRKILEGDMLTDDIIRLALDIIKQQTYFPGLQDTVLGAKNQYEVQRGPFCQILHSYHAVHWIVSFSPEDAVSDEVFVYDSLSDGKSLHPEFVHQICNIRNTTHKFLKLTLKPTPMQTNGVDCGVFAIANALELCIGRSPSDCRYDIPAMRPHLLHCLEKEQITPFPKLEGRGTFAGLNAVLYYRIYCCCRDTYFRSDIINNEDRIMIKCSKCGEHYHKGCHNVATEVFLDRSALLNWSCANC